MYTSGFISCKNTSGWIMKFRRANENCFVEIRLYSVSFGSHLMKTNMEKILKNLGSKAKLDRDKGFQEIEEFMKTADEDSIIELEKKFTEGLTDIEATWETRHGNLMGCKAICEMNKGSEDFYGNLVSVALEFADDAEFRVRIAAGIYQI